MSNDKAVEYCKKCMSAAAVITVRGNPVCEQRVNDLIDDLEDALKTNDVGCIFADYGYLEVVTD
jgi:hypothetical protein